jgi:peroxiredoxin
MDAWGREHGAGRIRMIADGNGDFARALGLEKDGRAGGMGVRSQRYAMIVDDGVVRHLAVEKEGQFEVSRAESVLQHL